MYQLPEGVAGLIFDMDGTLIDSLEINWQAMKVALEAQGISIPREEFVSMTGRSLEEISQMLADKYRPEADVAAIVRVKREIANSHINDVKPIPAVAEIARANFGRIPMAVGTGSDLHRATEMLRSTGLLEMFPVIVAAEHVKRHKPEPDTFLKCAELMGVEPSKCMVFEDADGGIEAARRGGMMVCDVRAFI